MADRSDVRLTPYAIALRTALKAHADQFDKSGRPAILHPLRVMFSVATEFATAQAVAVLHDVVEDTETTLEDLDAILPAEIVSGVDAVTRRVGERYMDYIARAGQHPVGFDVKIADIVDNICRLDELPLPEASGMTRRYERALKTLGHTDSSIDQMVRAHRHRWFPL